jgi:hypothetical protein
MTPMMRAWLFWISCPHHDQAAGRGSDKTGRADLRGLGAPEFNAAHLGMARSEQDLRLWRLADAHVQQEPITASWRRTPDR